MTKGILGPIKTYTMLTYFPLILSYYYHIHILLHSIYIFFSQHFLGHIRYLYNLDSELGTENDRMDKNGTMQTKEMKKKHETRTAEKLNLLESLLFAIRCKRF